MAKFQKDRELAQYAMEEQGLSENRACRTVNLFDTVQGVRQIAKYWLEDHNTLHPHKALQGVWPGFFHRQGSCVRTEIFPSNY